MDETALRAFDMLEGKGVWYTAELERIWLVEGHSVEGNNAVPATLDWDRLARDDGIARRLRPEVWKCRCYSFVAIAIPERKRIVVVGRFGEVQGACCCIVAVSCCE